MFELSDNAEAALAYLVLNQQDCPSIDDEILVRGILELRENGMANAQTDWGQSAIFTCSLLASGRALFNEHQRMRREFVSISDTAEELMLWTYADYAQQKKSGSAIHLEEVEGRIDDYGELGCAGLLSIQWADNHPYLIRGVTEKGIAYARGDGYRKDEMQVNINNNFNPVNTVNANGGNAASNASATAESSAEATLTTSFDRVIDAIRKSELGVEDQVAVEKAVRNMNDAKDRKDVKGFLEAVEKATSIAKNVASIGGPLVTFIGNIAGMF